MFNEIFDNEEGKSLFEYLNTRSYTIYPYPNKVFNAFKFFELKKTKIVLLGQDPYINFETLKGKEIPQAMGLSFSVPKDKKIPPSLRNIFQEIHQDINLVDNKDKKIKNGDLTNWAKQGVLLLNCALTVRQGKSNSHYKYWNKTKT